MSTERKTLDSVSNHVHREDHPSSSHFNTVHESVNDFIKTYGARAAFFTDAFIKKLKDGNRKALAELQRHPFPPTQMDLRNAFAKCLDAHIPEGYNFAMKDGKHYTMRELKRLVPEWAAIADQALMASDPALADKLMTPAQWNAKSAFEVTFVNAMNELNNLKKSKQAPGTFDHYMKWIINPLKQAMEQVKVLDPPGNALIGYGNRIPLVDAMSFAENLQELFQKTLSKKGS
jgi:hypothetical protein